MGKETKIKMVMVTVVRKPGRNDTSNIRHVMFSRRPGVCGGMWCLEGHRIWVSLIKRLGKQKSIDAYPWLTLDQIDAAISFRPKYWDSLATGVESG